MTNEEKRAYWKSYKKRNKDLIKQQNKDWYLANRKHALDRTREYEQANKEKIRLRKKAYREAHQEELAAQKKEYRSRPETQLLRRVEKQRRRFREVNQLGPNPPTSKQLKELLSKPCAYCPAPSEQIDHVVPLAKGGLHDVSNLAPACAKCNRSKKDKDLDIFLAERLTS